MCKVKEADAKQAHCLLQVFMQKLGSSFLLPVVLTVTHCTQASDAQAPDIWRRLPYSALVTAVSHHNDATIWEWDVKGALCSMTKAAAEHSLLLERETDHLREEVKKLQATVAELESWRQQQVDLQGTVAALGAQVQALLQHNIV